jgi:hypothetical protein
MFHLGVMFRPIPACTVLGDRHAHGRQTDAIGQPPPRRRRSSHARERPAMPHGRRARVWSTVSGGRWPARYEIRIEGVLDERWSEWFAGLSVTNEGDETILSGSVLDQPALHGVLERVHDLGLSIIAVQRLSREEDSAP